MAFYGVLLFLVFNISVGLAELSLTDHDINVAIKYAQGALAGMQRLENNLKASQIDVEECGPSHGQLISSLPSPETLTHARSALIADKASLYLILKFCRRRHRTLDCARMIMNSTLDGTGLKRRCSAQYGTVSCGEGKFRGFDGVCNHPTHPTWGQAYSPYRRLLPATYHDGIMEPRRSANRVPLPSARLVSNALVPDLDKPDDMTTLAMAQWAMFISNDLFQTAQHKMFHTGSSIECCRADGRALTPRYIHPQCLQVVIPNDDPDYSGYGMRCMNYVRSVTSLRNQCNLGAADQMNQASHYLDGSMIYGNTAGKSIGLREMSGGRLATSEQGDGEFLPLAVTPELQCQTSSNDTVCFNSGDSRVNQNPQLTAMYTIWMREHNRIADTLQNLNPHWDDKKLFHEARRIVIAQIQHITYKSWLPMILGSSYTQKKGLDVKSKGFGGSYDHDLDPSVSNEVATAAFNFVNSLLQKTLRLVDEERKTVKNLILQEHFNKPDIVQESEAFDHLVRGITVQKAQKIDASVIDDVTSKLYKGKRPFGFDIMSLDVQRERDHGLPGYNAYRKFCNLPTSAKFETWLDTIPKSSLNQVKSVYNHPDDVDLVIGAILESPVSGGKVGPTLQCLLGEQFTRTRRGDRYFYDLPNMAHSFSDAQIAELKKGNLARLFCDNLESIAKMQADVFQVPHDSNPLLQCSDSRIPSINLNAWKDSK